jgi:hypothetical protein
LCGTSTAVRKSPRSTARCIAASFFAQAEAQAFANLPEFDKDPFDAFLECITRAQA